MFPEPIPLKPPTSHRMDADGITRPRHPGGPARFLTDVIVDLGLVPRDRVASAIEEGRRTGKLPEEVLLEQGALTADGLSRAVAERHGLDHLDLGTFKPDMTAANLISVSAARRYEAVPVDLIDDRTLLVAMADPSNVLAVDDIALLTGKEIRPAVTSREDILGLISRLTHLDDVVTTTGDMFGGDDDDGPAEVVDLRESADDAPVIRLVNQIIAQAVEQGASDVHLEPNGSDLRVRFRIDGVLVETAQIQRRMVLGVISRVKIMSDLDISERRIPQDGRVGLTIDSHHIDLRVVTLPSVHGESVVMRILDKSSIPMDLEKLGMAAQERERFERAYHQAYGAVLVTGPTGSGKSTTLYAALADLNTIEKNIITIEDPVEYQLDGITQVQVNPRAGLHFHTGLRSMMRADPDIIMVGEIRDRETAQIAIESALTGHLVLSTLHTNDAASAVTRLVDMGIEPFLVASAIDCVVAQRLARKLCQHCKERQIITADVLRANGIRSQFDMEAYQARGCPRCGHSGYKGRIGLYEVMVVTEEIRKLTLARASAPEIADVAVRQGMRLMRDDGLEKVRHGLTSIEEVTRVSGTGAAVVESG
ncbi:MAG TPA: ATPase, T2SS/T4P/T4SS family [Solirubrobacteraceae bacterium]|jgi:type IV pilus assembly protein PilB|nr:ATPase, T2SS/T4P/T4SS family [Solirubrobacteraceae bacterium]